jgi:hypothetical protein
VDLFAFEDGFIGIGGLVEDFTQGIDSHVIELHCILPTFREAPINELNTKLKTLNVRSYRIFTSNIYYIRVLYSDR